MTLFLPRGGMQINELYPCRHGLVERNCSLLVEAVWSAGREHLIYFKLIAGVELEREHRVVTEKEK